MLTTDALLAYAATVAHTSRELQDASRDINLLADVEWGIRQKVRDIEGHLSRIEDTTLELLSGLGFDEAIEMIESIWGPFADD